ncbi:hypothetical protein AB0C38_38765 [Amycolatopsis sp. NPDC048633]|uniref:hypothetical protein n=1 Tax=Amycolatopsis sp. NPDC048633 TaxID=3157095 RepID=UPI0033F8C3E6
MTDSTPAELARTLQGQARSAATTALREGLEDIEARHGQHTADEVAALIDVAGVFEGLTDRPAPVRGDDRDDDGAWEFKPLTGY